LNVAISNELELSFQGRAVIWRSISHQRLKIQP